MMTVAFLFIALCFTTATAQLRDVTRACGTDKACHPWDVIQGPHCGRANPLNLRFILDIAPENNYLTYANTVTMQNITYAFCPVVDELQAFNLTNGVAYAALDRKKGVLSKRVVMSYLSVFGFGSVQNVLFPNISSDGSALIVDNGTNTCDWGEFGIVKFLLLNITFSNGRFRYWSGHDQPAGVGFLPSCDENDVCQFDTDMICIGEKGRKNCGRCYSDPAELESMPIQVWASYYGTDRFGRNLRSGANNPMNFRAFAGSGTYSSIEKSINDVQSGKLQNDNDLEP